MSAVPFELEYHLSALIAYRSLSSLALVIKNSSVSLAKKKASCVRLFVSAVCHWLRLNVSCSEHVAFSFSCRWIHQEAFSMWSGFIIAQALSGRCVKCVCVCVTDEQQCCEPHGSQQQQQHRGRTRIRKGH